jgi:hypothetical protein
LLLVLVALLPFAYASPPDPVWLAGIYDVGDSDDVILVATSLESLGAERCEIFSQDSRVSRVSPSVTSRLLDVSLRSPQTRAPPTA